MKADRARAMQPNQDQRSKSCAQVTQYRRKLTSIITGMGGAFTNMQTNHVNVYVERSDTVLVIAEEIATPDITDVPHLQ